MIWLSMKRKIRKSFVTVLVICIIAAFLGAGLLQVAGQNYKNSFMYYGETQGEIGKIGMSLHEMKNGVHRLLQNVENIEQEKESYEAIYKKIQEQCNNIAPIIQKQKRTQGYEEYKQQSEQIKTMYRELESSIQDAKTALDDIIKTVEQGNIKGEDTLKQINAQIDEICQAAIDHVEPLVEQLSFVGNEEQDSLSMGIGVFIGAIIVVILLSIIIAIIITNRLANHISKPAKEMSNCADALSKGNLQVEIANYNQDEIGILAEKLKETIDTWRCYISEIKRVLAELSKGNFDIQVEDIFKGDFIEIKEAITNIIDSFNQTFYQLHITSEQMSASSDQVAQGASVLAQGAVEQTESIDSLLGKMDDIAKLVIQNAEKAKEINEKALQQNRQMENSNMSMEKMIQSMDIINETSQEISKVIEVINGIAFQTNILSLNAAVEAARAGEAGKGFAVVAENVRDLASQSAKAAKDTETLIEKSIQAIHTGNQVAKDTEQSMEDMFVLVEETVRLVEEITEASIGQSEVVERVKQNVGDISTVVQTNSATAQESSASSEELYHYVTELKDAIARFKRKEKI